MRKLVFFIIILSVIGPLRGQTSYDVEYAQVCLIDSIAPDTVIQFWRFTQANNPGEYSVDMTFDLASSYTVEGTVLPCCSCLTEAMAANGGGGIGDIAMANPPPINALLLLSGAVLLALIIPRRKIAVLLILAAPAAVSAQPGTTYDIEHTCICLVDSIAADTVIQFWRFTQSNNPGEYSVDVTFDFGSSYTVAGTVLSCKDYYLGDNPGGSGTANTLAMWTGTSSLGNSSVTQSGTVLSSSFTGAFKPPSGTTVQQPVGSPGYFRFNTTASGFEGYNGSAYRFLPWADAINPGANRLWFQNSSNTAMSSDANFYYSSGNLYLGTSGFLRINPVSDGNAVSIGTLYVHGSSYAGVAIGTNAGINGADGVAIGYNARSTGNGQSFGRSCTTIAGSVGVGNDADAPGAGGFSAGITTSAGADAVAIGHNTAVTFQSIGIGFNADVVNPAEDAISIGRDAYVNAREGIAIGDGARSSGIGGIAIGKGTYVTQPASIAFGNGSTTTAENELVIGSYDTLTTERGGFQISNVYFGTGKARQWFNVNSVGNGGSATLNGSGANGTNYNGGNIILAGGKGTGSGAPGDVIFSTSDAGASGTTLQTLATRVWIKGETGQLSVGTASPNASALVQVESTTQGFLPPRMTTTERDAIASPATGLVIFNTTTTKLECYDGATWQAAW